MKLVEIGRKHTTEAKTLKQKKKIQMNTKLAKDFADVVQGNCPTDNLDTKAALYHIERALEHANLAIVWEEE